MYSGSQKTRIIVTGAPTRVNGSFAGKTSAAATPKFRGFIGGGVGRLKPG